MTRYSYNRQITPAAPFVHVTLRCQDASKEIVELPAQLDTGADRTIVPWKVVEELGLRPVRVIQAGGFEGTVTLLPTFLMQVEIRQLNFVIVECAASRSEPYVLLGRDVLNNYRLLLDGPQLKLEIS